MNRLEPGRYTEVLLQEGEIHAFTCRDCGPLLHDGMPGVYPQFLFLDHAYVTDRVLHDYWHRNQDIIRERNQKYFETVTFLFGGPE